MLRRPLVFVIAIFAAAAWTSSAVAAAPRARDRSTPILFVHGLNPFEGMGYPCPANWQPMKDALRSWGWTGPLVGLKYYAGDSACDDDIDHDGSHDAHDGVDDPLSPDYNHALEDPNSHGAQTPIEHLGYHLAWYIYDHYSSAGQAVDLVGHSMGGLIIRSMLTDFAGGSSDFPPTLLVGDVITLETPHGGTSAARLCDPALECQEMQPSSAFLAGLAPNPQGTGGTDWTVVGSVGDELVTADSAVAMAAHTRIVYRYPRYEHNAVLWDTTDQRDAAWRRSLAGGRWRDESGRPHSVREVDLALSAPG